VVWRPEKRVSRVSEVARVLCVALLASRSPRRRVGSAVLDERKQQWHTEIASRVMVASQIRGIGKAGVAGVGQGAGPAETIGRLRARLTVQQALEDEVTEFLGRGRYERAEGGGRGVSQRL
jgi:hypothetical protein